MSERNEFDDLARRKLEEREFPFREADWLDAQRLIHGQRKPKAAWRNWIVIGAALMTVGAGIWLATSTTPTTQEIASIQSSQHSAVPAADNGPAATGTVNGTLTIPPATPIQHGSEGSANDPGTTATGSTTRFSSSPTLTPVAQDDPPSTVPQQAPAPRKEVSDQPVAALPIVALEDLPNGGARSEPVKPPPEALDVADVVEDPGTTTVVITNAVDHTGTNADPIAPVVETEDEQPGDVQATGTDRRIVPEEIDATAIGSEGLQGSGDPASLVLLPSTSPSNTSATSDTSAITTTVSEQTRDSLTSRPQDTAATALAAAPLPPLIAPDAPWEIGILFGGFLSQSTYTAGNSDQWIDGQTGRWSPAFGAEVMHMGRNFGIGSGLHYTTYQEDLRIDERTLTTTVISDSNYFQPFNTTILHVIGTVEINGQDYYVTESRDTTLNILVLATTTNTTTRTLIEARSLANRVSYFEVPLLLDAHVLQGPWALGVRGGPTIGLLSGKRGALPNAAFDGYTDLGTAQFRSPLFGFVARAYVRYRFVNGWAIGLEPTWRGHFGNALGEGDLVRKSRAVGGMISVSYRLR